MALTAFPVDRDERHFEDYQPGAVHQFGPIAVDEAEIVDFGRRFDPQPFHTDAARAARGPLGGVIASGWHTASLMMRLLVDHFLPGQAGLASPGVDELRWLAPVRPGDTLKSVIEVLEVRPSSSKPDRGIARLRYQAVNQRGEAVLGFVVNHLLRRRSG